jgi:hypothetical protein
MGNRAMKALGLVLVGVVLAAGCGEKDSTIKGEVTLDDRPLDQGRISFVPVDGKTPSSDTAIKDGKFSVKAAPGSYQVKITSNRSVGKQRAYDSPDSPQRDVLEQYLPGRYNKETELKADVKAGANKFDFPLKSK